ncbi:MULTISPECIES: glycogen-binding domain-containing protein [unclassified Pseudodesulfovibrio]|uniref:glycogen-binding domain-containing protein n=1 Tax=unclassified Pseudodesulfovibrio TaxID=2661612 RepID=UPI000FEC1E9E|nr:MULTISPECIES: glycogen-binding domain-containing protein [unclassified Pseudodesulfovibrio]MCJ2163580.1 glycogen-binding domain-containing protein [Pseudodesulfovibrio sp. S3-i]RWU06814.1 hypothetical protein DWB63_03365 [Pseudodesulfovibrio sp. S3]
MTEEQVKIRMEDIIIQGIRNAPEADAPQGFSQRVMDGLQARTPSLWTRVKLWLFRPQVLTVKPMQVIPAVTFALALLALAVIKWDTPTGDTVPRLATVRFILHDTNQEARKVSVIGSFNNWRAERSVMWYNGETQAWILEAQLPPGDHEYLFLVNGERLVPDPEAPMTRDDGFGNRNSIMFVNVEHEHAL